jgi:hypothetical protein
MSKKKNITITIQNPCHEKWGKMTPNGNGRHCDSCNKTVIDFSKFTDREIIEVLKNIKGSLCGRFTEYQVNRPIAIQIQNGSFFLSKAIFGTALLAGVAASVNAQINHQSTIAPVQVPASNPGTNTDAKKAKEHNPRQRQISGVVTDKKTGEPIRYVEVCINFSPIRTETDSNGNFNLVIPDTLNGKAKLHFYIYGHKEREFTVNTSKPRSNLQISLRPYTETMITGRFSPAF